MTPWAVGVRVELSLDLGGVELAPLGPVPGVVGVDVGVAHEHLEHRGGLHVVALGLDVDRRDQRMDEHAAEVEGDGIDEAGHGVRLGVGSVEHGHEPLGRDDPVGLLADAGDLVPVDGDVES